MYLQRDCAAHRKGLVGLMMASDAIFTTDINTLRLVLDTLKKIT